MTDRDAYLARARARAIAVRDGSDVPPADRLDAPTFSIAAPPPPAPPPAPEPVVDAAPPSAPAPASAQPSPYGDTAVHHVDEPDDIRVELAGIALALASVSARLVEIGRRLASRRGRCSSPGA